MRRIGLIAGAGMLPVVWAQAAYQQGVELVIIGITPETEMELLNKYAEKTYQINVGQLETIIQRLKSERITESVMMGKVEKVQLYQGVQLDQLFIRVLQNLPEKNDDAILLALVQEMARSGIRFIEQTNFMDRFLAREGNLLPDLPVSAKLLADMEYGFKMAKEIGRLDIGQTVVVKDGAVIAVEAIEGTDLAILRGGELARGVVVAKVSKPQQDFRFDLPTIGLQTMENLVKVQAQGLVVEAEKTFFIQQDEVLQLAKDRQIAIMAMR